MSIDEIIGQGYRNYIENSNGVKAAIDSFIERLEIGVEKGKTRVGDELPPEDCCELYFAEARTYQVMAEAYSFYLKLFNQTWGKSLNPKKGTLESTKSIWKWYKHDLKTVWEYGIFKHCSISDIQRLECGLPEKTNHICIGSRYSEVGNEIKISSCIFFTQEVDYSETLEFDDKDFMAAYNFEIDKLDDCYSKSYTVSKNVIEQMTKDTIALCTGLKLDSLE